MNDDETREPNISALHIFGRVLITRKEELYTTFIIMILLMFFSAIMIYIFEKDAQPKVFSGVFESLWWAVAALTTVGYGDVYPITVAGKIFAALIAMSGIGMFALPTGILGSGFVEEIGNVKSLKQNLLNARLIKEAFEVENLIRVRRFKKSIGVECARKNIEFITLQNELNLSEDEVFQAIKSSNGLRVRNVHSTEESALEDILVVEKYPCNTSYGALIHRSDRVTVINSTAASEAAVGHFSEALSSMLNAHYISNEYYNAGSLLRSRRHNFSSNVAYLESERDGIPELMAFSQDIQRTVKKSSLVILFFSAGKNRPDVTFSTGGKKGEPCYQHENPTFDEVSKVKDLCRHLETRLHEAFQLSLSDETPLNDFDSKRISQYIRTTTGADVLTLRVNIKTLRWADIEVYYKFIATIADAIKSELLT